MTRKRFASRDIHRRTVLAGALLALALALAFCALFGSTASAQTPPGNDPPARGAAEPPSSSAQSSDPAPSADQIDPEAVKALAKQHHITLAQAKSQLARERSLGIRGEEIEKKLRGGSGGTYLDESGRLVVTTLDAESNAVVTQLGAKPKHVDDSSARLDAIVEKLNRYSAKHGVGAVQGWHVDVESNSVVVTITEGATDSATEAIKSLAASFGDSVKIESRPAQRAPKAADWSVGGFQFVTPNGGYCSEGFNARDAYNRDVVVTAGHCVSTSGWISRNGFWFGNTRTANFPADDFGTFWNQYPGYWQPSPSVYRYDNNTYVRVAGRWDTPLVGTTICKSGRTTGWTCGTIKAVNQTVNYRDKLTGRIDTIYGLVQHNACTEPGDSGGAVISGAGWAVGLTSGASTTTTDLCWGRFGQESVAWYQPVGEALDKNGLRLAL